MIIDDWRDWTSIAESVLTSVAVIVAGIWAYFHYFRGRIYRARLEPSISASLTAQRDVDYILLQVSLKNVGLSRVDINQEGTALQISGCTTLPNLSFISSVSVDTTATFEVFKNHRWIESGELITEHHLFATPKNYSAAYQVKLRVVAAKISWTASDVIVIPDTFADSKERM